LYQVNGWGVAGGGAYLEEHDAGEHDGGDDIIVGKIPNGRDERGIERVILNLLRQR